MMQASRHRLPLRVPLRVGGVLLAVLLLPRPALAENLMGRIRLASGAPVPGVEVRLCNTATKVCGTAYSNATGYFRFVNLAPGQFTLEARPRSGSVRQDVSVPFPGMLTVTVR